MTDLVLPARRLEDSPRARVFNATLEWLLHQPSADTRVAYQRGLTGIGTSGEMARMRFPAWLPWLQSQGVDPLQATIGTVDLYGRQMAAAGVADRSAAQRLALISSWYGWLVRSELTDRNPAAHATRPNVDPADSPTATVSVQDVRQLLATAKRHSPMAYALYITLYLQAFRVGSVLRLNVRDLRMEGQGWTLRMRVKGGRMGTVALDPLASDAILAYLATRPGAAADDPLFVTDVRGGRIGNPGAGQLLKQLCGQAGIAVIPPHGLRNAHVDHALDAGVPLPVIQATLGHARVQTTMNYETAHHRRTAQSGTVLAAGLEGL